MSTLTAPSLTDAERITREVSRAEALGAALISPMAGSSKVRLRALAEVAGFLRPLDTAVGSPNDSIAYVDPPTLVRWVREIVGDAELAADLEEVVASNQAYGLLVPMMQESIVTRLEQCDAVMAEADTEE